MTSPRRETLDMLKEAIFHADATIARAAKITKILPVKRPGYYSVVTPRDEWKPAKSGHEEAK